MIGFGSRDFPPIKYFLWFLNTTSHFWELKQTFLLVYSDNQKTKNGVEVILDSLT